MSGHDARRRAAGATHAEVTVAAAPEQVWEAIATGPGHAEWLFGADIDGREGGAMVLHRAPFGPDAAARVTGWDPPRRFAYTEPLARDDGGAVPWPRRSWSRRAAVAPAWCGSSAACRTATRAGRSCSRAPEGLADGAEGPAGYLAHFAGQPAAHLDVMTGTGRPLDDRAAASPPSRACSASPA